MKEQAQREDRDEVLYAFHQAFTRPSADEIAAWTRRYPEFAEDIVAHAAVAWDWASEELNVQVEFNNLLDQIRRNPDPKEAAMRLFQGIAQMFTAAKDDPAKIEEVSKNVHAHAEAFSKAVVTRLPGADGGSSEQAGQTTINKPAGAEPLPAGRSTHEPASTTKHSSHASESKGSATKGK